MNFETFLLERNQSLYENIVEINLTESGLHATSLRQLLTPGELSELLDVPLGYGHTEGTPDLRAAIANWHPGATTENVLVTTGASEANLLSLLSTVSPGDEVIVIVPNFMQIPGVARAMGAQLRCVPLAENLEWAIDARALESVVSSRTKLIALCNPNNPTGHIAKQRDRDLLIDAAASSGAWLLVDEIYRGAELAGRSETETFWGASPRVIVTGGMAKAFGIAGLRIGWIVAPHEFLYECMRRQDYTTIGTSPVSQYVTARLLHPGRREQVLARSRGVLNCNLELVRTWVNSNPDLVRLVDPEAGGMALMSYAPPVNSTELSRGLRERESVFVVPGDWFGLDRRVRIGFGGDSRNLLEGLMRFGRHLRRFAGHEHGADQ